MIQEQRLKDLLLELVQIDSLSLREGKIARRLKQEMESLGGLARIDDAGERVGGDTGNLIVHFPGNVPRTLPILLSAHMDTVKPGEGVVPVLDGNVLRSDGRTVLGGDDKSGVAIICEVLRVLKENQVPHSDIDVVFTICEEVGLLGAKCLDVSKLKARFGLVLDSDSVGFLFTKAPAANHVEFEIQGLEAHAGVCPERGVSAIQVAAAGIANMKLGRVDDDTTANLGFIEGGTAINVIPNSVSLRGEARSHSEEKLEQQIQDMTRCLEEAASSYALKIDGNVFLPKIEAKVERQYDRMDLSNESPIVKLVHSAGQKLGMQVETLATGGGCDANVFNKKGVEVANLSTGMRDIHTVKEWLDLNDLYTSARIVFEIVRLNAVADLATSLKG
ncbi:MAG: M20/M25/M40 family metallo-hydrolase [Deltaproteobacteria bacterium]|nr:M20/M25/M40 family metallo-hydrolase [Deltaproteobacteria bacterium]